MAAPVVTSNSPSAGYITWTASRIVFGGNDYPIPANNTNKKFVYWKLSGSTPGAGGTGGTSNIQMVDVLPDPFDMVNDCILFINKSGVGAFANNVQVMDGSLLVSGSILADAIGANQVVAGKIAADAVDAAQLKANAVTAAKIGASQINANHISSGAVTTDKLSVGAYTSNLAPNPYFEDWPTSPMNLAISKYDPSAVYGYKALDSGRALEFNYSWGGTTWTRAPATIAVNTQIRNYLRLADLESGATYTSAVTVANPTAAAISVQLDWADGGVVTQSIPAGQTMRLRTTFARSYDSTYRFSDLASAGEFLWKDWIIQKGDVTGTFFDGDTAGYAWTSTPTNTGPSVPMPDGWTELVGTGYTGSYVSRETAQTVSGSTSLGLTAGASQQAGIFMSRAVPCTPGDDIYLGAYFSCTTALTQGMLAAVYFYNAAGQLLDVQSTNADITGTVAGVQQVDSIQHVDVAPATARWMQGVFLTNSTTKVLFDNVEMGYRVTTVKIADGAVTAQQIKAGEVWAGEVPIGNLTAGGTGGDVDLSGTSLTGTSAGGGYVRISEDGIGIWNGTDPSPVINLPTDISKDNPAVFRGAVEAQQFSSTSSAELAGLSRIATGSSMVLGNVQNQPAVNPTFNIDWENYTISSPTILGSLLNVTWDAATSRWIVCTFESVSPKYIRWYSVTTAGVASLLMTISKADGDAYVPKAGVKVGGVYVYIDNHPSTSFPFSNLHAYDSVGNSWFTQVSIPHLVPGVSPVISTDGTDIFAAQYNLATTKTTVYRYILNQADNNSFPLTINGDFETNITPWVGTNSTTAARDTTQFNTGVASLSATYNTNAYPVPVVNTGTTKLTGMVPGRRYKYKFSVRSSVASRSITPTVNVWYNSTTAEGFPTIGTATNTGWTTISRDFMPAQGGTDFTISVAGSDGQTFANGEKFYVDSVSIYASPGLNLAETYTTEAVSTATSGWTANGQLSMVYKGNADFGAARWVIGPPAGTTGNALSFSQAATPLLQSGEIFPPASATMMKSMAWADTFYSIDSSLTVYKHSQNIWTAAADGTWWLVNTWQDTTYPMAETAMGAATSLIMKKRARITITAPDLPATIAGAVNNPTAAGFYMGKGTTAPTRTNYWYQGNAAPIGSSLKPVYATSNVNWIGGPSPVTDLANPPDPYTNAFPFVAAGSPGKLVSQDNSLLIQLNGDGTGKTGVNAWGTNGAMTSSGLAVSTDPPASPVLGQTYYDSDETSYYVGPSDTGWVTGWATNGDAGWLASNINYCEYRVVNRQVEIRMYMTTPALDMSASTGNYANQIALQGLPGNVRPTRNIEGSGRWDDAPIAGVLDALGRLVIVGGVPGKAYTAGMSVYMHFNYFLD